MSLSLSLGSAPAFGSLNAYWGQHKGHPLRAVCDSGVQYATVAFVTKSPEQANGYPAINLGANCAWPLFHNKDGEPTEFLSDCPQIKEDISYCQAKGVKVLLSIGGQPGPRTNYKVSDSTKGIEFADYLYKAFGPREESWVGPRPFGNVTVDGFDLDVEDPSIEMDPYVAMVNYWRQQSSDLFITAAPQCVTSSNHLDYLIKATKLDALFIQFYNNPVCDAIPGNTPGDAFSYDEWVSRISGGESKNAKIFIGLPASTEAAGSGYIPPAQLQELVCQTKGKANFGGISLWDATFGLNNTMSENKSYVHAAHDALQYDCNKVSTTTTSTAATADVTGITSAPKNGTTSSITPHWSNSTTTSEPASLTTSTVFTTKTYTVTSCAPTVTDCPKGHVTTETIPLYTTVCPVTETAHVPEPTTTTKAPLLTTSTVYTTKIYTLTSCPPYVVDCPKGEVTTEVIPVYTTVCPVNSNTELEQYSSLETSIRPTAIVAEASSEGCSGPDCPAATSTPGSGCTGPECPGVAVPTNSWTSAIIPTTPIKAGASALALSLTGLVAVVVAQIIAM
ncbi:hypothetical protein C2857_000734 [Epichloe festucae Fl1]|uniref:GH18 domain-containing protein n=1 Tax=Epichloe festucae (strain Fl1) TaxID=877507 RepID=A0A7S9PWN1_EPIFF|nr:hypothetical protein C2857_000734 [Epichloe festucae Fl1]